MTTDGATESHKRL